VSAPASLRRRLLLAGSLGVATAALLAAWLLGLAFERAALRSLDDRLEADLDRLVAAVEVMPDGRTVLNREPADERYDRVFSGWYWAWRGRGTQARASRSSWDDTALLDVLDHAATSRNAAMVDGPRAQRLRVLSQRVRFAPSGVEAGFAVAGDLAAVHAEASAFRWFAGAAVAGIALALLGVIAWQVGYGLQPLRRITDTLLRIRRGEDARFAPESLPGEIAPLAAQVNELLDEHGRRVERARHAAQDLAHALKTPLAALALDADAGGSVPAAQVQQQVTRMRAVVERQLSGGLGADPRQRTPVAPVLDALCALLRRVHGARGITFSIEADADLVFAGSRDDLEEMLGNLLDNAGKWAATAVTVRAGASAGQLNLAVEDDGAGLEPEQAQQALQRGIRLDRRAPGTGLGLAIVQATASSYGGALQLGRGRAGGLRAELRLPAATA
jgi:signal transduction histidine kinase